MQSILPKKLPDFSQASILIIGDVMLDRYWFGKALRISPEAPVPIVTIDANDDRPGGAGNVALNISALGAKATLIGITGQDEAATILEEQLAAAGAKHDFVKHPTAHTITKLRVISRHQQLIRLDFEEKLLPVESQRLLEERYQAHVSQANMVILSDYNKGTLCNPQFFIQCAREKHIPVLVDPKNRDFNLYRGATLVTPNLKEFEDIVGPCHSEQDILEKGQTLLANYQIDMLLLTRGEQGMTLICQQGGTATHLPAYAREVYDVTGAGDTVIAVLAAALATGATAVHATALANLAASLVVAKLGAATISAPELEVALSGKTSDISGVVNEEQLWLAVKTARVQGKKIVFTNGCFDILHAGHVAYLQDAKQLGDYLIVAINDDASVRRLKGSGRPINNQEQRMAVLAGLGMVDWVVTFPDDTPERLLKRMQPDILVKGSDYSVDNVVGADIVYAYGGEVRVVGPIAPVSTTAIIESIKNSHHSQEEKTL
ncbi:MAG: bifunctional heptose 7-phosphate kinase/heptose 1-phosphate adenyltransferase [Gammaproteobacteria bacterium RIFCSPHIGHO2_12_FULL_41_20]|nr:MAG: bifunctional heptose 7-phosphate kinase/heptose 1-phosphate adenyltransferase [Gammaproteobacteria bacterium RIFCSPHIGHO2_12_FULL_41_20]